MSYRHFIARLMGTGPLTPHDFVHQIQIEGTVVLLVDTVELYMYIHGKHCLYNSMITSSLLP